MKNLLSPLILFLCSIFAFLLLALSVQAGEGGTAKTMENALRIATGPRTGTYIAFGKDIAALASRNGLPVAVLASGGSIDNIRRIAGKKSNADVGIVQSDVLGFLRRSQTPDSKQMAQHLRMVLPFYREEVHLLARKNIVSVNELDGKRVVVGGAGSGSMLTSVNMFSILGIKPEKMYQVPPPEGIVAVLNNEADAIIFVGGKPVRMFKNMEDLAYITEGANAGKLSQVHFLPLDDPKLVREYSRSVITAQDYNYVEKDVPTLTVTAVLVTRDFDNDSSESGVMRCGQIKRLVDVIRNNIGFLKANSHPKWHEVDLAADVGIWQRDRCAWPEEKKHGDDEGEEDKTTPAADSLEKDLMGIITRGRE